jgi:hypothetical protein
MGGMALFVCISRELMDILWEGMGIHRYFIGFHGDVMKKTWELHGTTS